MSRTSTLILLGILVILTPYSGLPVSIRSLFEVILGACIAGIGLSLRARDARGKQQSAEPTPVVTEEVLPPQGVSPI